MPSKKPIKAAKKPGKAIAKKATPKAAAPKKLARPATKTHPKPVLPKVAVKSPKTGPKSTAPKPAPTKALRPKPATTTTPATKTDAVKAGAEASPSPETKELKEPKEHKEAKEPKELKETAEKSAPLKFDIRPLVVNHSTPNDEEGEFDSPTAASLLAGPRNVKPYITRRGEQYMNKEQLEHFARILRTWKRDLMVEVDRTVLHMKDEAANFPDPNDRATQEEEFSLELRTRDRERKLIRKIDEALKRIEDGSYGYCLETGEEIGIKRLEARPVATLSVEAQERRERREKQYGDRDDRYR
jgi:DnaK suppressor protein